MPLGAHKAAMMGTAGVSTGDVVLLSSQTADGDASISFTSGITSAYGEYIFGFVKCHTSADGGSINFQASTDGGSNYGITLTSTAFTGYHNESNLVAQLAYKTANDLAQSTSDQGLITDVGNDADQASAGALRLFNPASTTYVKHWYFRGSLSRSSPASGDHFTAGYLNTTSAINAIIFRTTSGTFDGTIKMWGVK